MPCPDTVGLRHKFLEGDLEEVYNTWKNYLFIAREIKSSISMPCQIQASKMLGILSLVLRGDSAEAKNHFYMVARYAPFVEMWEYSLPMEVQTAWDTARANFGPQRTADQIWRDQWLPPVTSQAPSKPEILSLRRLYHDSRVLYALARDPDYYVRIMQNIRSEMDPAFQLLRVDVMMRMGYGIGKAENELGKIGFQPSLVIAEFDLFVWQERLYRIAEGLKATVDPKPEKVPSEIPYPGGIPKIIQSDKEF